MLYAVAGLPLGRLADRWSRKWLLAIGIAVWAGLTGMSGLADQFRHVAGDSPGRGGRGGCVRAGGHELDRRPGAAQWPRTRHGRVHDGDPGGWDVELRGDRPGSAGPRMAHRASHGRAARRAVDSGAGVAEGTRRRAPPGGPRARAALAAAAEDPRVLVDRGVGRGRELRALQLLDFPGGLPDARTRPLDRTGGSGRRHRHRGRGDLGSGAPRV